MPCIGATYSNRYSNPREVQQSQPERTGQPIDCGARSVVAGVPVDVTGDRDGRVPEQVAYGLDMHPGFEPCHGRRVPQGVDADALKVRRLPAAAITRRRFRGSTGRPDSVVKTWPVSCQTLAASMRSSSCDLRCLRSRAVTPGDSGSERRERAVFGSVTSRWPFTRPSVPRTSSTPASQTGGYRGYLRQRWRRAQGVPSRR